MYKTDYQLTHDIDWFFLAKGVPVHMASDGGRLPFDSYKIDELVSIQHRVAKLEPCYQCYVNMGYLNNYLLNGRFYPEIDKLTENQFSQLIPENFTITPDIQGLPRMLLVYGWSFIEMAKKGFYSFDRAYTVGGVDYYHLVAYPQDADVVTLLHEDLLKDLKEYQFNCFPPQNDDYESNFPSYMKFVVPVVLQDGSTAF